MRLRPRFSWGRYCVLEPDEGKLSSPVLGGLSGRKAAQLPDSDRSNGVVLALFLNCTFGHYCQRAWSSLPIR